MLACDRGHEKVVTMLLHYEKLELECVCAAGKSAIDYARSHASTEYLADIVQRQIDDRNKHSLQQAPHEDSPALSADPPTPASDASPTRGQPPTPGSRWLKVSGSLSRGLAVAAQPPEGRGEPRNDGRERRTSYEGSAKSRR